MKLRTPKKNYKNRNLPAAIIAALIVAAAGILLLNSRAVNIKSTDLNNDGIVSIFDLSILLSKWSQTGAQAADLNGDNVVNIFDLSILLGKWGTNGEVGTSSCLVGTPNDPGTADPWGGYWPGPQNTGVPAGTTLKVLNPGENAPGLTWEGTGWHLGQCGLVLDGYEFHGSLYMRYGNTSRNPDTPCVTIKNSKVVDALVDLDTACLNSAAGNAANHCGPLVIQDSELYSPALADRAEVIYDDFHLFRTEVQGTPLCNGTCTIKDSWIHSLWAERGFHMDAVSSNGNGPGNAMTVTHSWLDCGGFRGPIDPEPDLGCSTVLASFPDFNTITLKATYNYLAPARQNWAGSRNYQPPYCLNPGPGTTKPYPTINTYVAHNVFARGFTGHCGLFGAVYGFGNGDVHQFGTDSGNVWGPGNMWDDGTPMNSPNENAIYNCTGQGCLTY